MFDEPGHGGSVDWSGRSFRLRATLIRVGPVCASLFALLWLTGVHAGPLYRCAGSSGETVFSSSTTGYRGCHRISTFSARAPSRQRPPAQAGLARVTSSVASTARDFSRPRGAVGASVVASLTGVRGSVETSAQRLDAAPAPTSLAAVKTSAQSAPQLPPVDTGNAVPGQWSYRESHDPLAPSATANDVANRVLRGAVYRIVRPDGSVEYTNLRPAGRKGHVVTMLFSYIATCAACNLHSPIHWGIVALNLTAYADTIRAASIEYGVDEAFLRAIIHAESAFNPRALSLKGAQGLMQLMPSTAGEMGVLDAFNTDQNIRGGARYLGLLLRDFNGNERLAAAAYNAGPAAVVRYNGVPPYAETRVYVERVGALRARYSAAIHPPLAASR